MPCPELLQNDKRGLFLAAGDAATYESVEEEVCCAEYHYPVGGHVVSDVGNVALNGNHDSATEYHRHENTRSDCSVFAKSLNGHVEDATPHNRGAKTYEEEGEDAHRHSLRTELERRPVDGGNIDR